jgi:hypothetical protein
MYAETIKNSKSSGQTVLYNFILNVSSIVFKRIFNEI